MPTFQQKLTHLHRPDSNLSKHNVYTKRRPSIPWAREIHWCSTARYSIQWPGRERKNQQQGREQGTTWGMLRPSLRLTIMKVANLISYSRASHPTQRDHSMITWRRLWARAPTLHEARSRGIRGWVSEIFGDNFWQPSVIEHCDEPINGNMKTPCNNSLARAELLNVSRVNQGIEYSVGSWYVEPKACHKPSHSTSVRKQSLKSDQFLLCPTIPSPSHLPRPNIPISLFAYRVNHAKT